MGRRSPSKEEILDAIRRVARELGKRPSRSEFMANSGIREYSVLKHFPSWNNAVEAAGLEPDSSNIHLKDSALLEDWAKLVRQLRQIPTRTQYRHLGGFGNSTLEKHFGPWSKIPDHFRRFAENRPEWSDAVALLPMTATSLGSPLSDSFNSEIDIRSSDRISRLPCKPVHSKLEGRPL